MALKEIFSMNALPHDSVIWRANLTNQKMLLALNSGNVTSVHASGGPSKNKIAKEKEAREKTDILMQQVMKAAHGRFKETVARVKDRIAENRQYYQDKMDNLDRDEALFKKDTILLRQGLEVYPDADDPSRYSYQDETGNWHELKDEAFLEEAKDIHSNMGQVRTMQNKISWDQYKDDLPDALERLDQNEAAINQIERQVEEGTITPDEGREQVEEIGKEIAESRTQIENTFNEAFEGEAGFPGNEIKTSSDNELLEEFEAPSSGIKPGLSP